MLLYILLCLEIVLRAVIEVRERRLTQLRGGVFAVLRLIPLVNDIAPLPENRKEPQKSLFVEKHEEAHKVLHHAILRNLMKFAFFMCAVWFMAAMMTCRSQHFLCRYLYVCRLSHMLLFASIPTGTTAGTGWSASACISTCPSHKGD